VDGYFVWVDLDWVEGFVFLDVVWWFLYGGFCGYCLFDYCDGLGVVVAELFLCVDYG